MRGVRRALDDDPNPLLQEVLFGGEKGARNVPKGAGPGLPVGAAQKLEKSGTKAPEIFQQTGWYRGPDGQWKWILSDKGATLNNDAFITYHSGDISGRSKEEIAAMPSEVRLKRNPEGTYKLTDILNHPTLYETYPQFKNTAVKLLPPLPGGGVGGGVGTVGSFDAANNVLNIRDDRPGRDVLSTILHELQHGVQSAEGFGRGGSWEEFIPFGVRIGKRPLTSEEEKIAFDSYLAIAGETEARQAQKQFETRNWSQLPTQMEGFPRGDEQLVRTGEDRALTRGKAYQYTPVDYDPFNGTNPFAYRDDVINQALPARWTNDIVLQPETSFTGQGYNPPSTGEFRGDKPPLEPIPPSPWNRPKVDLERGWHDDPNKLNAPVSDEPTGPGYKSGFLSPAERGFIGTQPPRQTQQYTPIDYDPFATSALER